MVWEVGDLRGDGKVVFSLFVTVFLNSSSYYLYVSLCNI